MDTLIKFSADRFYSWPLTIVTSIYSLQCLYFSFINRKLITEFDFFFLPTTLMLRNESVLSFNHQFKSNIRTF